MVGPKGENNFDAKNGASLWIGLLRAYRMMRKAEAIRCFLYLKDRENRGFPGGIPLSAGGYVCPALKGIEGRSLRAAAGRGMFEFSAPVFSLQCGMFWVLSGG